MKRRNGVQRRPFPYEEVGRMRAKGKTIAEIAKAIGRVGEGKDPYHALRVFLTRMYRGYQDAEGELVKLPYRISKKTRRLAGPLGASTR